VRLLRPRSFLRKGLPAPYGLLSTGYAALDRAPRAAAIAAAISYGGTGRASSAPQRPRQLSGGTTDPQLSAVGGQCLFSDACMTTYPRAPTAGVRKAPRHEIAGGGALAAQRALWGFRRCGQGEDGGLRGQRWAGRNADSAMGHRGTSGRGVEQLLGGWYQPGMRRNMASEVVAGR
jgi:hypothetical protein